MKAVFLIPPSEGKNKGGINESEQLSFIFDKPYDIAINVTEKDLHCKDKRYAEALALNEATLEGTSDCMRAIERYSGVMYNAIDYTHMSDSGRDYFDESFLIVSGMYGLVGPNDIIGDYKLPIGAKGLYKFWGDTLTNALIKLQPDVVFNLLPQAYAKAINFKKIPAEIVHIAFMKYKEGSLVNMAHGVKKVKGEWIKNICENPIAHYNILEGDIIENDHDITIQIIQK